MKRRERFEAEIAAVKAWIASKQAAGVPLSALSLDQFRREQDVARRQAVAAGWRAKRNDRQKQWEAVKEKRTQRESRMLADRMARDRD